MVRPDIESCWQNGTLLSIADRKQYLLIEMPHELFVDLRALCARLQQSGVRPILAHPERVPELLHEPGAIEELIVAGCLVQVSSHSITQPTSSVDERALKDWFKRGIVHLMGSDGHSPRRRPPRLKAAYETIVRWAGVTVADRVFSTHGLAVLNGLPLRIPQPERPARRWFASIMQTWTR
jgi:protein-tyrosine phosphatase